MPSFALMTGRRCALSRLLLDGRSHFDLSRLRSGQRHRHEKLSCRREASLMPPASPSRFRMSCCRRAQLGAILAPLMARRVASRFAHWPLPAFARKIAELAPTIPPLRPAGAARQHAVLPRLPEESNAPTFAIEKMMRYAARFRFFDIDQLPRELDVVAHRCGMVRLRQALGAAGRAIAACARHYDMLIARCAPCSGCRLLPLRRCSRVLLWARAA